MLIFLHNKSKFIYIVVFIFEYQNQIKKWCNHCIYPFRCKFILVTVAFFELLGENNTAKAKKALFPNFHDSLLSLFCCWRRSKARWALRHLLSQRDHLPDFLAKGLIILAPPTFTAIYLESTILSMVIKDIVYSNRWNKLFLIAYIKVKYIQIAVSNSAKNFLLTMSGCQFS